MTLPLDTIIEGDSLEVMKGWPDNCVDAVVTDPPYGLKFMGKRWDDPGAFVERRPNRDVSFDRIGGNHNPTCSSDGARTRHVENRRQQAWHLAWAREAYRVLKPGGHLLAFGGTRTYHRLACAIEDAGFEIRDQLQWIYGSGFPKSLDVSKAIDKAAGAERETLRIDASIARKDGRCGQSLGRQQGQTGGVTAPATDAAKQWQGWGTALKPAHEPICLARKPLSEKTVAANVLRFGTGGLNIDGARIGYLSEDDKASATPQGACTAKSGRLAGKSQGGGNRDEFERPEQKGRWPANVTHDGSEEVLAGFPRTHGAGTFRHGRGAMFGGGDGEPPSSQRRAIDAGGTTDRFFYCAKASRAERNAGLEGMAGTAKPGVYASAREYGGKVHNSTMAANHHPTVKPLKLMRYLCRLITPPGGIVLDPFAGSGSTCIAAIQEGFRFVGIEKQADYVSIARCRIEHAHRSRVAEIVGDLFAGAMP